MTRYYFYSSAKDELEIIESGSLEDFAAHEFDISMVFTGVVVEAQDFGAALKVYQNPTCGEGEYMMADEPAETVTRRQIANAKTGLQQSFDSVKARLEYLRACLKMKAACLKMQEANRLLNEASQELFDIHNRPKQVPPATIFERLSDATIKATIKYYGDSKKSG
jgi:hypothetical protein